jgi:hypothetical protein
MVMVMSKALRSRNEAIHLLSREADRAAAKGEVQRAIRIIAQIYLFIDRGLPLQDAKIIMFDAAKQRLDHRD